MVEKKTEEEPTKVPESRDNYEIKEVITQTDQGIGKTGDEGVFTDKGLLLELLNKIDRIEKAVV